MRIDLYTKLVLTMIGAALCALAMRTIREGVTAAAVAAIVAIIAAPADSGSFDRRF